MYNNYYKNNDSSNHILIKEKYKITENDNKDNYIRGRSNVIKRRNLRENW